MEKQKALPSTMTKGELAIHDLAQDCLSLQDRRAKLTSKLKDKRSELMQVMKKENCTTYHGGGLEASVDNKIAVKVTRDPSR